jgi:hypothetical protein
MKGHIRERSPGHWAIVLDVRDPQTGKRSAAGIPLRERSDKRKSSARGC